MAGSSKSGRSSKGGAHKQGSGDHQGHVTTDHEEIRKWVEERGGHPATVKRTMEAGHKPGLLRIDFPGFTGEEALEEITWNEFFEKFDAENLAFLYQEETSAGKESRFSKLISRDSAEEDEA